MLNYELFISIKFYLLLVINHALYTFLRFNFIFIFINNEISLNFNVASKTKLFQRFAVLILNYIITYTRRDVAEKYCKMMT